MPNPYEGSGMLKCAGASRLPRRVLDAITDGFYILTKSCSRVAAGKCCETKTSDSHKEKLKCFLFVHSA